MFIKVKVFPDSKEDHVEQVNTDTFRAYTREPASQGLANKRMLYLMAQYLSKPQGSLRIMKGHTTPNKIVEIPD